MDFSQLSIGITLCQIKSQALVSLRNLWKLTKNNKEITFVGRVGIFAAVAGYAYFSQGKQQELGLLPRLANSLHQAAQFTSDFRK